MKTGELMRRMLGIALVFVMIGGMFGWLPGSVSQVEASPATIYVPDDYATIQAAVNAASPGNTIIVRSGIYTENVDVDRQLTLIGEGQPVIDANGSGSPITLQADLCTLEGFAVQNSGSVDWDLITAPAGIKVVSNGNRLINNVASNNWYGIHLHNSRDNSLMGNIAWNNLYHGIRLSISDNNTLRNNVATNNKGATANVNGIQLWRSNNNTLDGNTADSNDYSGIELWPDCNHNTLINNTCNSNERGAGIHLDDSSHNILTNNLVSLNRGGISVWGSPASGSGSNVLTKNVMESNVGVGLYIDLASPDNVVYLNNLLGNDPNLLTHSASSNAWNSLEILTYAYAGETHTSYLGNYWSDYAGTDADGDGVGDIPYVIDCDADNYPLMEPFHNYLTTSGGIGDWNMTTSLPQPRRYHTSVEHSGNIYVIGGYPPHTTDVWYSRVRGDGSLSTWQSTTSLPDYRAVPTSVVHKGHVYVVGGLTWHVSHDDVWYSRINADGTLGPWMSTTALPDRRAGHASVVHNNRLYVLGGTRRFSQSHSRTYNDVWYAEINSDDTVGSWVSTTALPLESVGHTALVHDSHLYVIDRSDIWFTTINSDGSLGDWIPTNPVPVRKGHHTSVLHDGHIYVIGGGSHQDFDTVWYAPIHSDGAVGNWNQGKSLVKGRASHSSISVAGHVYAIGGYNYWADTYYRDVEYAPFLGTSQAVGLTVLIESLSMTHGPYIVGDTLTANFRVKNIGNAAITLDKLLLGGRYNGGELPGGGFPDFTYQTVTLQPGQTHEYEGTFTIPAPGDYHFFIAYYIENPTEVEKQFLDEYNWNTRIDLGPGLTDADRTRQISVIGSPWPMGGQNRQRTSSSPYIGPELPKLKPIFTTGQSIVAPPVIDADGTIYVGTVDDLFGTAKVYAINPEGTEKWPPIKVSGSVKVSPALVADGTLYVVTHVEGFYFDAGNLYAIDTSVGSVTWHAEFSEGFMTSPLVGSDGTIHVGSTTEIGFLVEHNFYAIDHSNGSVRWSFPTGGLSGSPAMGIDDTIYMTTVRGELHAIDPSDGSKLRPLGLGNNRISIGADGTIYMVVGRYVYARDPNAGNHKWEPFELELLGDFSVAGWTSPAVGDDVIYVAGTEYRGGVYRDSGYLYAIDRHDGSQKWSPFKTVGRPKTSTIVDAGGTVYFATQATWRWQDNKLYAVSPDHGSEKWSLTLPSHRITSPIIAADGTIYVGLGRTVYAIEEGAMYDSISNIVICSPVEPLLIDPDGRRVGIDPETGEVINEIAGASYSGPHSEPQIIVIPNVGEGDYPIQLVGTTSGKYSLHTELLRTAQATITFAASDILVVEHAVHQYTIDWDALAEAEDGVTVDVDADGDGVFEKSFTTGSELTVDEFILKTETIVTIDPETLNLHAPSQWITAYIELPEDYAATDIDINTVQLLYNGEDLYADWGDLQDGVLMVKFDWATVTGWFAGLHDEAVELMVAGKVDGIEFEGTATIRVIDPPRPRRGR